MRHWTLALLAHAVVIAVVPRAPEPRTDPDVVVRGWVEVARDDELGSGVLVSTPTDEFVIATNARGCELARLAGDEVEVRGSLVERSSGAPTLVPTALPGAAVSTPATPFTASSIPR